MKVRRIILNGIEGKNKWMLSEYKRDQNDVLNGNWDKESELRLFYRNNLISVDRFRDSTVLPEYPIGDLVNQGVVQGNVYYWDNEFGHKKFGKTCIFSEGVIAVTLYIKTEIQKYLRSQDLIGKALIFKYAAKIVLDKMGIETELFTDADMYLLPSRDKFACGYGRIGKVNETEIIKYEGGWITYYMDHSLFQQLLPEAEYNRSNSHDPKHGGIDGIENKFPDFDREQFENEWFLEIAKLIEEEPIVNIIEDEYL